MNVQLTGQVDRSLAVVAREVHELLGGRALLDDIAHKIAGDDPDLYLRTTFPSFKRAVGQALAAKDAGGLPRALSVDGQGTYVQRTLFDLSDYETVIKRYVKLGVADLAVARALADECAGVLGVTIDVDHLIRGAA